MNSNKTMFDINLPSIPGKMIKFKIQNIKASAFSSQQPRFRDNKRCLTKKFIDSFKNFQDNSQHKVRSVSETQTEEDSEHEKSRIKTKKQDQFRYMIPEEKKSLIMAYENLRNEEENQPTQRPSKGYSFSKQERVANSTNLAQHSSQNQDHQKDGITQNYYFSQQYYQKTIRSVDKNRPSAVFKNQTRERVEDKKQSVSKVLPGPGSYLYDEQVRGRPRRLLVTKNKKNDKQSINYQQLRQILSKVVSVPKQQQSEIVGENKPKKPSQVFIEDDRDRFGEQKFPIVSRLSVPGPGAYGSYDNISDHVKKIQIVQQQRKLLREWFNN